ncbi:MAG: hypothetical protein Q4C47_07280, partial [Planctomycetia bacterium]|nr:hypothetical protein [Planctomycetia bacterium]
AGMERAEKSVASFTRFDRGDFDTAGFRFEQIDSFDDRRMLPGAVKFGDIPGMIRLSDNPATLDGTPVR